MMFSYIDDEPIVPLEMQTKDGEWIEFHAYVDTGAGYSVFHSDHAELLGIQLEAGRKIFFTVGNGSQIPAFIHTVSVTFAGERFQANISFSSHLGVGTNLLGLASFFDEFSFCFHHS